MTPILRRRYDDDNPTSTKHILHTFRPEERLGELRLGLAEPTPPPQQGVGGEETNTPTRKSDVYNGDGSRERDGDDGISSTAAAKRGDSGTGGADRRREEAEEGKGATELKESRGSADEEEQARSSVLDGGTGKGSQPGERRKHIAESGGSEGGSNVKQSQASMWRSRWIFRDRRSPAMEPDELQVEVRISSTDTGWVLWSLAVSCQNTSQTFEAAVELLPGLEKGVT